MTEVVMVAHWDWVLYNFRLPVARALREQGCRVTFVCPYGEYTGKLQENGFPCIPWYIKRRNLNPVWEMASLAHLICLYRRLKPDVVHHFTIKPNLYGTIAARCTGVPVIINTFTGMGYLFSSSVKARLLRGILRPLLRWGLAAPSATAIFQNPGDRQTVVHQGILAPGRTRVIPGSGVDVRRFHPRHDGSAAGRPSAPVVLLASRLLWDKGVQQFVEAARILKAAGVQCHMRVAGSPDHGNPMCVPAVTLEGWQREGNVEFLGHREDIPELLSQTDVAVLPTGYQEGVPKFLIEGAAAGLPLVATDIEGCRMVVRKEVNGLLVPLGDSGALADSIQRLLADENLRRSFGKASREIAVREFCEERIIGQYLEMYRQTGALEGSSTAPLRNQ